MRHRLLPSIVAGALACAGAAVLASAAQQQKKTDDWPEQDPASAFVLGRVVDAVSGRAVRRAAVTLALEPAPGDRPLPSSADTRALTDGDGRFLFRGLAAGRYRFTVTAPGHLDGAWGQRRPGGAPRLMAVDAGQAIGDVTIGLWPEASISGAVVDEASAPVPGLWVSLLRRARDRTGSQAIRNVTSVRTDDRGAYRFSSVLPGTYYVAVATRTVQSPAAGRPGIRIGDVVIQTGGDGMWGGSNVLAGRLPLSVGADGRVIGYATTYHPGSPVLTTAASLAIDAGDDVTGIDVHLRPTVLSRVTGTVMGPSGPEAGLEVALIPAFAANQTIERTHGTISTTSDAKGGFSLVAVPAGSYRLRAWRRPQISVIGREAMPPDATLWSDTPIEVGDTAVEGLTVSVQPGATLSGRVRLEGTAAPINAVQFQPTLSVAFEPPWSLAYGGRLAVRVNAELQFTTEGLPPGRYFANLPNQFTASLRGWYFESATHAGKDLTRTPLVLEGRPIGDIEITFSDRRSEIYGAVLDASGRPSADAVVAIFPGDYRAWIRDGLSPIASQTASTTQRGEYALPARPGEYLVAVVADEALEQWPDAAAIETIAAGAMQITIARGERRRLDLRQK